MTNTDDRLAKVMTRILDQAPAAIRPALETAGAAVLDNHDQGCDGHESLAGNHMGETVYCDGSCKTFLQLKIWLKRSMLIEIDTPSPEITSFLSR